MEDLCWDDCLLGLLTLARGENAEGEVKDEEIENRLRRITIDA
jgi:hypothetical protein